MKNLKRAGLHWYFVLVAVTATGLGLGSCTYDYFVDETNYQVYVPEVEAKTVDDCIVLVYEAEGSQKLVFQREARAPFNNDEKIKRGLFSFKLFPGRYNVMVFTNTGGAEIAGRGQTDGRISLKPSTRAGAENSYEEPSDLLYDLIRETRIDYPAPLKVDTTDLKVATGRIEAHFKNYPYQAVPVASVEITVNGAGIYIPFEPIFRTTRYTPNDIQYSTNSENIPAAAEFAVGNRYLPSIAGVIMYANLTFRNAAGLISMNIENVPLTSDLTATGTPLVLNPGDLIKITFDQFTVIGIELVGWNPNVETGGEINGI